MNRDIPFNLLHVLLYYLYSTIAHRDALVNAHLLCWEGFIDLRFLHITVGGIPSCLGINFSILHTLLLEVVFMDRDFRVADLSAEKVAEINEFQKKLRNETNQNIVLIAYEPGTTK